jgi:hypothetical protein
MPRIGSRDYNIEFNDSVFETKAWQNARYNGQELNGAQINRWTEGDITYGKTPVVSNVSRNIYIGNAIIPTGDITSTGDETLVQFPSSSYVQIGSYITINNDDTITENNYDGSDLDSKNGFYRAFYEDFPIGGNFQIKLLTNKIGIDFLLDTYKIIFNQGRLHQNVYWESGGTNSDVAAGLSSFIWGDSSYTTSDPYGGTFNIRNNQYTLFYQGPRTGSAILTRYEGPSRFFTRLTNYLNESIQNRVFVTFENINSGSIVLDSTYQNNYIGYFPIDPGPLARFATAEISNQASLVSYYFDKKSPLAEINPYLLNPKYEGDEYSYYISSLNNSTPSILTNLYQPEQLPQGVGDTPFVVIPSNIHPYIKDNLLYFLSQAGIDIGSPSPPTQIYAQNRQLK